MDISNFKKNKSEIIKYFVYLVGLLMVIWIGAEFFSANYPILGPHHLKDILAGLSIIMLFFAFILTKIKNAAWMTVSSILLLGLFFVFLTPINDVPDEAAHVARSMYTAEGHLLMHDEKEKLKISTSVKQMDRSFQKTLLNNKLDQYQYNGKKGYTRTVTSMNSYSFISYIPQSIGINIGRLLKLNLFWIYYLGRIINLLFYAGAIFLAIKLAGKLKYLISLVALLPMNIYLAASFNQDSFSIGITAITISLFLRFLTDEKTQITLKHILWYTLCCLLLIVTKLPYALLILLLLFIPNRRFDTKKWWTLGSVAIVGFCCLLWILYYTHFTPGNRPEHVDAILQLKFMFAHPLVGGKALINGLISAIGLSTSMFTFGWLTYASWEITIAYIVVFCLIIARKPVITYLPVMTKIGLVFSAVCVLSLIYLSQYLTWTSVGAPQIQGVQGRYFIGLLFLLPVLLEPSIPPNNIKLDIEINKGSNMNKLIYTSSLFVLTVLILTICRYY